MKKQRQSWESMKMKYEGNVREVVQQGGGKTIISTADPGEPQKVSVQG